jgi:hypothetical protein
MATDSQRRDEAPPREGEPGHSADQARVFDGQADDAPEARRARQAPAPPPAAMTNRDAPRLEQLAAEARYHRQRLDLYRARLYGGRAVSLARLEEFQRASDGAAARLRQAREAATPARPRG